MVFKLLMQAFQLLPITWYGSQNHTRRKPRVTQSIFIGSTAAQEFMEFFSMENATFGNDSFLTDSFQSRMDKMAILMEKMALRRWMRRH